MVSSKCCDENLQKQREEMLSQYLGAIANHQEVKVTVDVEIKELVEKTKGKSMRDIRSGRASCRERV